MYPAVEHMPLFPERFYTGTRMGRLEVTFGLI